MSYKFQKCGKYYKNAQFTFAKERYPGKLVLTENSPDTGAISAEVGSTPIPRYIEPSIAT